MGLVEFARTISERTDAEVVAFVNMLAPINSRSRQADHVAHARIIDDLSRRVRSLQAIIDIGCTRDVCRYPDVVGLSAGGDIDIDGNVWKGSRFDKHLDRCPSMRRPTATVMREL